MIRLWPSGADELAVAPPTFVDDSGDSWFAGAMQSFASVAIAGALLASVSVGAARAQFAGHQDEPAGSLRGVPEETEWRSAVAPLPLSFVIPAAFAWEQHEQLAPLAVPEESEWRSGVAPVPLAFNTPAPFAWEQHEQAAGLYGVPEEDAPPVLVRPFSLSPILTPVGGWANDEIAPQVAPSFVPDDDLWVTPTPQGVTSFALPLWNGVIDEIPIAAPPSVVVDDGFTPARPTLVQSPSSPPWFGAVDEIPAAVVASFVGDDDAFIPPVRAPSWRVPSAFVDDGSDVVSAVAPSVPEYPPGRFTLDDIQPRFALDEIRPSFVLADIQPRFLIDDVVPHFAIDDPQATFTLRQDYPS